MAISRGVIENTTEMEGSTGMEASNGRMEAKFTTIERKLNPYKTIADS